MKQSSGVQPSQPPPQSQAVQSKEEMMPVHSGSHRLKQCPKEVPFSILNEERAKDNHSQSLKRLKERGGMGVLEILDNIHDRKLSRREENVDDVTQLNLIIQNKYSDQTASPVSEESDLLKALLKMMKAHEHIGGIGRDEKKEARDFALGAIKKYETKLKSPSPVSTQDPFIEKHLAIIREKMMDNLIHVHIEGMAELEKASVEHFLETGKVNGSFYLRLKEILTIAYNWNKNQPPVSTQVQGVSEEELAKQYATGMMGLGEYDEKKWNYADKVLFNTISKAFKAGLSK